MSIKSVKRLIEVALPIREISTESTLKMLCRQAQFLVDESEWGRQGQEVEAPREPEEQST